MKLKILETGRKLKGEGVELVDLFDTCGSDSPLDYEWVAVKIRRPDAEQIVAAFEVEKILRAILSGAHGALADASDIPVPAFNEPIEGAIRQLIDQRNAARAAAEAARNYAAATAGLDDTDEGAALLAAIREMEKDNG